jgi:RNA polymerase subunit RPABC4/transcription elongation factor Spt4
MTAPTITTGSRVPNRFDIASEVRVIPAWAYILAAVIFVGVQAIFHTIAWPSESNPPPLAIQILFPIFIGIIPAFFMLLIGYVNRDAGRRGMRRALWTAIVIFFPYAIGFILYFFMRKPLEVACGRCGAVVSSKVNYCPRCANAINPTCPHCHAVIGPGDAFCANCGRDPRTAEARQQEQPARSE